MEAGSIIHLDDEESIGDGSDDVIIVQETAAASAPPSARTVMLSNNALRQGSKPPSKPALKPSAGGAANGSRAADGTTTNSYASSALCDASAGARVKFGPPMPFEPATHSDSGRPGAAADARGDAAWDGSQWQGDVAGYPILDPVSRDTWEWPTHADYTDRQYQLEIASVALFQNTLVSLPTGLGKTFIAAVVMHNYYRWFPTGAIVFLAPTRPLVSQQIEACHRIVGIPASDTAQMQGTLLPPARAQSWRSRRVFYCTPQTFTNDIEAGRVDPRRVVLVVLDEAHRAAGDHAYNKCIRALDAARGRYRVLALSATPGADVNKVQNVVSSLHISRLEVRTHDDDDVKKYQNDTLIDKIVVPLSPALESLRKEFHAVVNSVVNYLHRQGAMPSKPPPGSVSLLAVLKLRETVMAARNGGAAGLAAGRSGGK